MDGRPLPIERIEAPHEAHDAPPPINESVGTFQNDPNARTIQRAVRCTVRPVQTMITTIPTDTFRLSSFIRAGCHRDPFSKLLFCRFRSLDFLLLRKSAGHLKRISGAAQPSQLPNPDQTAGNLDLVLSLIDTRR